MGEKRNVYVQQLKDQIDKWNADIDKLQAKADQLGSDAKAKMQDHIDGLKAKRSDLEKKMGTVQKAGGDAWEDLKVGANQAVKALEEAVSAAKSRFK